MAFLTKSICQYTMPFVCYYHQANVIYTSYLLLENMDRVLIFWDNLLIYSLNKEIQRDLFKLIKSILYSPSIVHYTTIHSTWYTRNGRRSSKLYWVIVWPLYIYPPNTHLLTHFRAVVTCCKKTEVDGRQNQRSLICWYLVGLFLFNGRIDRLSPWSKTGK